MGLMQESAAEVKDQPWSYWIVRHPQKGRMACFNFLHFPQVLVKTDLTICEFISSEKDMCFEVQRGIVKTNHRIQGSVRNEVSDFTIMNKSTVK